MLETDIPILFGKAGLVALIFCFGFVVVVYVPALVQLLLMKLGMFLPYYPPEYFYEQYLLKFQRAAHPEEGDNDDDDEEAQDSHHFKKSFLEDPTREEDAKNFFGYYDQPFFTKYPRGSVGHYCCSNFVLLVTICMQIALLMCVIVIFCVTFDLTFADMTASALFPTVFAIFHFSEFIKGYFAYIWFIWSNTLRLGHEIDIDNLRGDLVELGPVISYIYVYMRGVPMIGSVEAKVPTTEKKETPPIPTLSTGAPVPLPTPTLPSVMPSKMPVSLEQFVRNRNTHATIINVDTLHQDQTIRQQMPMISGSYNKPLRVFNFEDTGFKVPRIPDSIKTIKNNPESLNFNKVHMYQVGYIMLPLEEHFRYQVNTASLLSCNFRNYSYNSVHVPIRTESKKKS